MSNVQTVTKLSRSGADSLLTGEVPLTIRSFTDSRGASWRVRATPPGIFSYLLPLGSRTGWITFVCAGERRRLEPIPADWLTASPSVLEGYCNSATRIHAHRPWYENGA